MGNPFQLGHTENDLSCLHRIEMKSHYYVIFNLQRDSLDERMLSELHCAALKVENTYCSQKQSYTWMSLVCGLESGP